MIAAWTQAASAAGGKIVLIRRPGRHAEQTTPHRVAYVAGGLATTPWLRRAQVADPAELLDLPWRELAGGRPLELLHRGGVLLDHLRAFPLGVAQQPTDVDQDPAEEHGAVDAADPVVERQQHHEDRRGDHDRHVEADDPLRDEQPPGHGGHPEDEQHVRRVRADHVAEGDIGLARQRRREADGHLRCTRAERDHGEPDDDGFDAEASGDGGRTLDEELGAAHEQRQPGHDREQAHGDTGRSRVGASGPNGRSGMGVLLGGSRFATTPTRLPGTPIGILPGAEVDLSTPRRRGSDASRGGHRWCRRPPLDRTRSFAPDQPNSTPR